LAGTTQWLFSRVGTALAQGDRVRTSPCSYAEITFADKTVMKLYERSELTINAVALLFAFVLPFVLPRLRLEFIANGRGDVSRLEGRTELSVGLAVVSEQPLKPSPKAPK